MTDETVISKDVAEAEFARFGEAMALDFDKSAMDDEDRAGFERSKRLITRAMQNGHLVVNDNGEPVYTPWRTEGISPITFKEPTGATFQAMDQRKKSHDVAKLHTIMAAMTGQPAVTFSKLAGADYKVCQEIVLLFLG